MDSPAQFGELRQRQPPRRSKAHLAFIRKLPCCNCGLGAPSTAHHLQGVAAGKALGQRTDDYLTVPLCWNCHQHGPTALHNHPKGERDFWGSRDPIALAHRLELIAPDIDAATWIIINWREAAP